MVQCMESPVRAKNVSLDFDFERLNERFENSEPMEILAWCVENITEGLAQTTAFSILSVTHMLYRELNAPVPVIFLDTLHHFPETLETAQRAKEFYGLDLHVYQAKHVSSREEFAARYGDRLWERDVDRFHYLTKVEPLQRALCELEVSAWVTGRRRDQSHTRQQMPIFEQDTQGRVKVNPLANWTRKELWSYTYSHNVLYNPLHDRGYTSIGDEPLTTPILPGEDERAGRWRGSVKTECGIHV
ncbi:phosphoadenosine phosphosulfate reductase [Almyronema epifaneia]|uniref:Phosphoadenosine 5'-phosphosulfate reductase n=1 Tax=Almyronema epifaneia S1 TaxID=2991925 RepID=A0ABW6IBM0_9CYAN